MANLNTVPQEIGCDHFELTDGGNRSDFEETIRRGMIAAGAGGLLAPQAVELLQPAE